MNGRWTSQVVRDKVVDFIKDFVSRSDLPVFMVLKHLGIRKSKYYDWLNRYGQANQHNGAIPKKTWIQEWEKQAVLKYFDKNPNNGYRRLSYMMNDANIVAISPSSIYRILKPTGRLDRWHRIQSKKGTGFEQPTQPHEHWHIDISYINMNGTFYYLCSVLDGFSRAILHWEISESMKEYQVELILEKAREAYPGATTRVISDNGPQFIANDFKSYIKHTGMTHWRTAPYYPQSNGKIERWHKTLKKEAIRPANLTTLNQANAVIKQYIKQYNTVRLHSAIGYVTPQTVLDGKQQEVWKQRKNRLKAAKICRIESYLKVNQSAA